MDGVSDRTSAHLARLDRRAPRYTSFPTAAQFTSAVGGAEAGAWLAELRGEARPVSIYVHLPFCRRLCWYCGCNTRAVNRASVISSYVELLDREASLVSDLTGPLAVSRLHLGGGTPNMLSPEDLDRLFAAIISRFDIGGASEIAAEIDPATLDQPWVEAAARHGLSRASLGVQDLSPRVQKAVNRVEPFEVIARASGWLREAGVASINLDLMYGLPEQQTEDVLATLDSVLTLKPDRIALFGYAHVPWMKPHQRLIEEARLPGTEERLDQSQAASRSLLAAGYQAIGIDHFSLPHDALAVAVREGRLKRSFQGYTDDPARALVGLGASSISSTPAGYWQNQTTELAWRTAVTEGRLPVARGVALSEDDRLRARIIERLMCDFEVDLAEIGEMRGLSILRAASDTVAGLEREGLVTEHGARLKMTDRGRPFVRLLAAAFDPYLDVEATRHARVS
jgi:oxygen-independent coproporphyrinogen-3 oxidase